MYHRVGFSLFFFTANAEPTRPPLATISDEAMAMVKRAAVVPLVNIGIDSNTLHF
jgi:hypothetical protein